MKKRFVAKKNKRKFILKLLLWFSAALISFYVTFNILFNFAPKILIKEKTINLLFSTSLNTKKSALYRISPKEILLLSMGYILNDNKNIDNIKTVAIDEGNNDDDPRVYIYNTHDGEAYTSHLLEAYNIAFTVKTASFIMRDYLSEYGIPSYVETNSMKEYLNNNKLTYKDSYTASRYYINKIKENFSNIELFIDIHRDSASSNVTEVEIDGKKYAKILFVVGLDHSGYESNLHLAELLNSKLDSRISRGISKKSGSKVNGIYNQDLSNNCILIEIGGVDNTIEEVNNSIKLLSKIIFEYLNEE